MSKTTGRPKRRRKDNPDAAMPLVDHLRELRTRLFVAAVAIGVGSLAAWLVYDRLITLLREPWTSFQQSGSDRGLTVPNLVISGIAAPFTLQLRVSVIAGVVLSCPIWLYELWAFITPGLKRNEKRWTVVFLATAVPLFVAGVVIAFLFLPKALQFLIGFTPRDFTNFITVDEYMSFVTRMMLVFGVAFLLPLFVVLLNLVGILSADRLRHWWRGIIFGVFLFAAVATPTGDPWTMLALATPMLLLLLIAFGIAWLNDRRRAKRDAAEGFGDLADDEISPIGPREAHPDDDVTSVLDGDDRL